MDIMGEQKEKEEEMEKSHHGFLSETMALSPSSISLLEESEVGARGVERILLHRLLARKELRLVAMREKVTEVESRLREVEELPGFAAYQRVARAVVRLGEAARPFLAFVTKHRLLPLFLVPMFALWTVLLIMGKNGGGGGGEGWWDGGYRG